MLKILIKAKLTNFLKIIRKLKTFEKLQWNFGNILEIFAKLSDLMKF